MSIRNNDVQNNELFISRIETTDTISQFMEKCNRNFTNLIENNGGPIGSQGERGEQGAPTKPKVPIHAWKKGKEYETETSYDGKNFEIYVDDINEDLTNVKYQEGHLILLENAHVYILEVDNTVSNYSLKPRFLITLQLSYNQIGNSIFKISENEIEMSVKNCGLKITNEGIFIKKPNREWFELDV